MDLKKICRTGIPGYDPRANPDGCEFDLDRARRAIAFFYENLSHIKGELGGKAFELEKWQIAIVANLFGWKRKDGTRRYRECYCEVPRKNGKTTLAAGIAL